MVAAPVAGDAGHVRLMPSVLSALTSEIQRACEGLTLVPVGDVPGMCVWTLTVASSSWSSLRLTKLTVLGLTVCWRVIAGDIFVPSVVPRPGLLTETV